MIGDTGSAACRCVPEVCDLEDIGNAVLTKVLQVTATIVAMQVRHSEACLLNIFDSLQIAPVVVLLTDVMVLDDNLTELSHVLQRLLSKNLPLGTFHINLEQEAPVLSVGIVGGLELLSERLVVLLRRCVMAGDALTLEIDDATVANRRPFQVETVELVQWDVEARCHRHTPTIKTVDAV
eukprot:CAMPEP_0172731040 /NCGR_PEP_ID=MMETSP1074-20121228/100010_1 /TAXON_ID=2916 /ORGANISM="Ceratium fusus, Strain PA161109" /LENGTH=179 /DNA_ID=CAMNT_0013558927 /DNA_START=175 /DNA_END=714 /DNA_ORIENTATION=-